MTRRAPCQRIPARHSRHFAGIAQAESLRWASPTARGRRGCRSSRIAREYLQTFRKMFPLTENTPQSRNNAGASGMVEECKWAAVHEFILVLPAQEGAGRNREFRGGVAYQRNRATPASSITWTGSALIQYGSAGALSPPLCRTCPCLLKFSSCAKCSATICVSN